MPTVPVSCACETQSPAAAEVPSGRYRSASARGLTCVLVTSWRPTRYEMNLDVHAGSRR